MMRPKVTIVIPVYNGSNYLREAIDSALAQTYGNIEAIVVNDGSTDGSEEIALAYGDKVRYFSKENGGVSTALNLGIAHMSGQYFHFLPHDDVMHPDKIALQMEAVRKSGNELSVVWTGWNELREPEHKLVPAQIPPWFPKSCWTNRAYPLLFGLVNAGTVLIHRKYFESRGMFDESLYTSQDYDLLYRVFTGQNTIYLDEPLMDYRIHSRQGTQSDMAFQKNCQALSQKMVQSMAEEELGKIFPSRYKFLYEMLKYYKDAGWDGLLADMWKSFMAAPEPRPGAGERQRLWAQLSGDGRQVVIYGAGKNGKRLKRELWMHGIEISAFCDGDSGKVGREICGVPCIGKEALSNAHKVIISIDDPEPVRQELMERGLAQILDYRGAAERLWLACPIKERVRSWFMRSTEHWER